MRDCFVPELPVVARLLLSFLVLTALFTNSAAHGQSEEDVHIVPRNPSPPAVHDTHDGRFHSNQPNASLRVNVNLVLVPVSVIDRMNRPVTTLTEDNFAVYDNEKRQEIRYFSTEQGPLSVAMLVDVSRSMADKIDIERAAIAEFFKNADPQDEYFAITFSDRPRVLAASEDSIDDVEQKLTAVQPAGPTAMLDAIYLAIHELRSARFQRKAIVIFSDGGDNSSRYTMRDIKKLAQESDVQIYAIGLFETFFFKTIEERLGKQWLSGITDITGGRTIAVENRSNVPEAAAEISRELRSQYVIGYRPPDSVPNRWRKIRVKVTARTKRPHLQTHYKQGYMTEECVFTPSGCPD